MENHKKINTKKIILIVTTLFLYLGLYAVLCYFAINLVLPYRLQSYLINDVIPLYNQSVVSSSNDLKFLTYYAGLNNMYLGKNKLYQKDYVSPDKTLDLSLVVYPLYKTNGQSGILIYFPKLNYRGIDLTQRNRNGLNFNRYEYSDLENKLSASVQIDNKGLTKTFILDPFKPIYVLNPSEFTGIIITYSPNKSQIVYPDYVFYTQDDNTKGFNLKKEYQTATKVKLPLIINTKKLNFKGWPSLNQAHDNQLSYEKPNLSPYNKPLNLVIAVLVLLFVLLTYFLFIHRYLYRYLKEKIKEKRHPDKYTLTKQK